MGRWALTKKDMNVRQQEAWQQTGYVKAEEGKKGKERRRSEWQAEASGEKSEARSKQRQA
jgi:hypothetical protein